MSQDRSCKRPWPRWSIVSAIVAAAPAVAAPGAPAATVVTMAGHIYNGKPVFGAAGVSVGGHAVAMTNIVLLQVARHIPLYVAHGVALRNGSLLRGRVAKVGPKTVRFQSDLFGALALPRASVAAILFSSMPATALAKIVAGGPRAVLKNGGQLAGRVAWMEPNSIGFKTASNLLTIKKDRLRALVFSGQAKNGPPDAAKGTFIRLVNGDVWNAKSVRVTPNSLAAGAKKIPWADVAALWIVGHAARTVSSLVAPVTPPTGGRGGIAASRVWLDRSRHGFLHVGGHYFETGLACRPPTTIDVPLARPYKLLIVAVAVRGGASVNVQVLGDDKVVFTRLIKPGPPQWIRVSLPAVKTLRLSALPGPAKLASPRVVWADAFLLK